MSVTKKDIMRQFNVEAFHVEQQGSKQLFIVDLPQCCILVSYLTIVGVCSGVWKLTEERFSSTTTAQTNKFIRENNGQRVTEEFFSDLKKDYSL